MSFSNCASNEQKGYLIVSYSAIIIAIATWNITLVGHRNKKQNTTTSTISGLNVKNKK